MFHTHRTMRPAQRQGQALLVAVLLMMVILLTGILFVAIVSYNQFQSTRSTDVTAAQSLAQAGVRWCNDNLMHSPLGADWRPPYRPYDPTNYVAGDTDTWPVPPVELTDGTVVGLYGADGVESSSDDYYTDYEIARGWHGMVDATTGAYQRMGFARIPDMGSTPADVRTSGTIPLEIGELGAKGHILVRVTYDPDPPFEPEDNASAANVVTKLDSMSKYIRIEAVGVVDQAVPVWRRLVAYKPVGLTDYLLYVTDNDKAGRVTKLGFAPRIDMDNGPLTEDWLPQYFYGPLKVNTALELLGENLDATVPGSSNHFTLTPEPTEAVAEAPGINPVVMTGGYLRKDAVEASGGVQFVGATDTAALFTRAADGTLTEEGLVTPTGAAFDTYSGLVADGETSVDAGGFSRVAQKLPAPALFGGDGTGAERYRKLTRDSGRLVTLASGEAVNLGQYGFGRGIYIENKTDLQFVDAQGVHDLDALTADWLRAFPEGNYTAGATGWNAMQTLYTAPGVDITLFPTEGSALNSGSLIYNATQSELPRYEQTGGTFVWWPNHQNGAPGLRLTRSDGTWQWFNPNTNQVEDSRESTLYVDYPDYPNQVIFSEGNVRVHGVLPPGERTTNAGGADEIRDYNLTLVSGGSIYVEGQILSPQDCLGRSVKDGGGGAIAGRPAVDDELNTKIALLARDCVCLNTTKIVPQLTSGEVSVAPDDPVNPDPMAQHLVLSPEVQGAAYSNFSYGEALLPGNGISLTAAQSGADPGPTAVSLSTFNGGVWTPYIFGQGDMDGDGTNEDIRRFYLAQPGMLPVGMDPGNWLDYALAPNWGRLISGSDPLLPWSILAQITDGAGPYPGVMKSFALSAADLNIPGFAMGSSDYWVKRWKINETDPAGLPMGAVHAKVNALIYAENGCWFVLPGAYFDASQSGNMARRFRRYNYDISVRGMIAECFHADPDAVRDWSDKWAHPVPNQGWATIRYEYDESLRVPRHSSTTLLNGRLRSTDAAAPPLVPLSPQANLPKLPALPVSSELIFTGEGS